MSRDDASTTAAPARVQDPDWLAMAWWGLPLARAVRRVGLAPLRPNLPAPDGIADVPGVPSGHVTGVTPTLLLDDVTLEPSLAVVGVPPIEDCATFATLETLYDTVQPLLLARALKCPAVIYLGDRELSLATGSETPWRRVAERVETWIGKLSEALGVDDATIVRTSRDAHDRALEAGPRMASGLPAPRVASAFHVGADAPPPASDDALAAARRLIDAHLPTVVGAHAESERTPVVVAAHSLRCAGAVMAAASLAVDRGHRVEMVAHLPAPSASGARRMGDAPAWDKLPSTDLAALAAGRVRHAHPVTRAFFAAWLDEPTREALSRIGLAS